MAEDDWDGWAALTDGARRPRAARRRRPVRHQRRAARRRGIERRRRQLDPRQGQPDRHAHRDARHRRAGDARRLHERDVAPLAARPRTPPSPTSRSPPTAARSRPARRPGRDRVAKYNQLLRIEEDLGEAAAYRGRAALAPRASREPAAQPRPVDARSASRRATLTAPALNGCSSSRPHEDRRSERKHLGRRAARGRIVVRRRGRAGRHRRHRSRAAQRLHPERDRRLVERRPAVCVGDLADPRARCSSPRSSVFPTPTYLAQRRDDGSAPSTSCDVLAGAERPRSTHGSTALSTDAEIERLAREQYDLVRPGEQAFAILPAPAIAELPRGSVRPRRASCPTPTPSRVGHSRPGRRSRSRGPT